MARLRGRRLLRELVPGSDGWLLDWTVVLPISLPFGSPLPDDLRG